MAKPAKKKKMGRPKAVTPEIEAKLLGLVMEGTLLIDACGMVGVTYKTVAKKELEDDHFYRLLARARVAGAAYRLELADKRLERATNQNIAVVREQVQHERWRAAKLIPAYKDRLELQADVNVAKAEPDRKPLEQQSRAEKMLWVQRQAFLLSGIGLALRDDWKLENLAEACGYLGREIWDQVQAAIDGRPPAPEPAALLPAKIEQQGAAKEERTGRPAQSAQPRTEIEINPANASGEPEHVGATPGTGLQRYFGSRDEQGFSPSVPPFKVVRGR